MRENASGRAPRQNEGAGLSAEHASHQFAEINAAGTTVLLVEQNVDVAVRAADFVG